jgi:hypothetical protein
MQHESLVSGGWAKLSLAEQLGNVGSEVSRAYMEDKRTCVMPVKLEPGKTYVIWINSQKFNYFKDTQNNSAIPYLLVFETKK